MLAPTLSSILMLALTSWLLYVNLLILGNLDVLTAVLDIESVIAVLQRGITRGSASEGFANGVAC